MSSAAMKWALEQKIEDGTMKPVLVHLAWLHSDTRAPFPSQQTLADATGHSPRAVREALRLLEFFNVIRRKARSNGASGRTSDQFTLALGANFDLPRDKIRAARMGLCKRQQPPVAARAPKNSQPAVTAGAPGGCCRGIGDDQYPIQGKDTQEYQSALAGAGQNSPLRVIDGVRA